jgi:hypothetical protein
VLQKDLDVFKKGRCVFKKLQHLFKKARYLFHVGVDRIIPSLSRSSLLFRPSLFPFILTFQLKRPDNQSVKNDRASPHPRFSGVCQVSPNQPSAFALSKKVLQMKGG